jgi:hypothetical protein
MNRRSFIAAFIAASALPSVVMAQGFADQIVAQLRAQGFDNISVSNTWLGRTRITAQSADGSREIIIDPRTGEILRDLWQGKGSGNIISNSNNGGSGRDDDDDDDDDDEDDGDDDDDDDNSGSGGGDNSGHGGGGGGGGGDDDDDDDD